jgi:hypothetical protein
MNSSIEHPDPHRELANQEGGIDCLGIMEAARTPRKLVEMLYDLGKRQEKIIAKMADAVRRNDGEAVFQLAGELTSEHCFIPQPHA